MEARCASIISDSKNVILQLLQPIPSNIVSTPDGRNPFLDERSGIYSNITWRKVYLYDKNTEILMTKAKLHKRFALSVIKERNEFRYSFLFSVLYYEMFFNNV